MTALQQPPSIAVIGSGMAGLAAAYGCRKRGWRVTIFEAQAGHGMDAHALEVDGGVVDVPLRVMSRSLWSSVLGLADEVGVGSFAVNTYVSCSWSDRSTWFRNSRLPLLGWPMVGSWRYLNRRSLVIVRGFSQLARATRELHMRGDDSITLATFVDQQGFDPLFWRGLVLPLLTTICTCDEEHLLAWPARQLMLLFDGILHGDELVRLQGGTTALVRGLAAEIPRISDSPVTGVRETPTGVEVRNARGEGGLYDRVIVATQANQLDFLDGEQFSGERDVLGDIRFDSGELVVHRDQRFMPAHRRDWTVLNFMMDKALNQPTFSVWVNPVEPRMTQAEPVFQTWNPHFEPEPASILARVPLQRAVVHAGTAAVHKQLASWHQQPGRRVFYCGSWAYDGVPLLESAVRSAWAALDCIGEAPVVR